MRTSALGFLGAAAMTLAAAMPQYAAAAQPQRVPAYDCGLLAAQLGPGKVWQTAFSAEREDAFGFTERINVTPCFTSLANCKAWLYWARSDWDPFYLSPPPCKRGIRY